MVKLPNFVAKVSGINEFQTHHFQRYVLALSFPIYRDVIVPAYPRSCGED